MADMKSMLPDVKDVTSIATKLFNDIKKSVGEIVSDYKKKHCSETGNSHAKSSTSTKSSKSTKTKTETKTKK